MSNIYTALRTVSRDLVNFFNSVSLFYCIPPVVCILGEMNYILYICVAILTCICYNYRVKKENEEIISDCIEDARKMATGMRLSGTTVIMIHSDRGAELECDVQWINKSLVRAAKK